MTKEECIDFLGYCKEAHISWAKRFDADPEEEADYTSTGEWDSAEKHREYTHKYQKIIEYIKENGGNNNGN